MFKYSERAQVLVELFKLLLSRPILSLSLWDDTVPNLFEAFANLCLGDLVPENSRRPAEHLKGVAHLTILKLPLFRLATSIQSDMVVLKLI